MVALHWIYGLSVLFIGADFLPSTDGVNVWHGSNYCTTYNLPGKCIIITLTDMLKYSHWWKYINHFYLYFQICMISSALFHTFSCHSEQAHRGWQETDHFGIIWAMFGTYVPFLCQAFHCHFVSKFMYYDHKCMISF